ncbi:MAG TPA: TonB-dependent receptor [Bacteroidales bacterium]|nr:TonB-dependent receptor [Bacteroidales bacterium]
MKKNKPFGELFFRSLKKTLLIMRIAIILMILGILQARANDAYSQKTRLSLNFSETELVKVLDKIENESEFFFLYNEKLLDTERKVSMTANDELVSSILDNLFTGTDVKYTIVDRKIILAPDYLTEVPQPQQQKISGTVIDKDGAPIVGANVVVTGTTQGAITDIDGKYSVEVPQGSKSLTFTFIGMQPQEISIGTLTKIDVTMAESAIGLDEVVVIGYGSVKKSDLTGSVSSVKADILLNKPVVNIGQAMSGKVAGVEVSEFGGNPDGRIRVRIRGDNSISSSNDPLYVIDGVIGVANINLLNPSEIESLEVLKDASSTAIYGARGANGVIMITTKRGLKTEEPIISYDGYVSIGKMAKKVSLMNAKEWWQVYNTGMDNTAKYDPVGYAAGKYQKVKPEDLPRLFDASGNPIYDTDWQDYAYRTAFTQSHQVGVRGGSDKLLYSGHFGYMHKEALMKNNYLDNFRGRLNMDSQVRNWLKFGVNMAFSYNKGNDLYASDRIKRLIQEGIPIIPVKYPDGTWASNRDFPGAVQDTPARYLEEMVNLTTTYQAISDIYLDIKITKNLSLKSTYAIDASSRKNNYYSGKELIQYSKTAGGIAQISTNNQLYWQNENYFTWNKQINSYNKLNVMIGLSWQQRYEENLGVETRKFSDDFYQWHNLGAGTVTQPSSSSDNSWRLNSYFARFNYSLLERYLFTATTRFDGSSKFGQNNRYAFFPSLAFAWKASEEDFLKDISFLNNLKVRTSIGTTGNQEIGNYAFLQNLGSTNIILNNTYYTALYRATFGNPDLKWEKTQQWDAGVDIGILNNRIDLSADYYLKNTSDLLLAAPIPNTSGLSTVLTNIGSVRNSGFELAVTTRNIEIPNSFSWTSTVLFATNKNRITKLGVNDEDIFPGPDHPQGQEAILRVGEPVGSIWGLTRLGTWGLDEDEEAAIYNRLPGDLKYADLNHDGQINNDDNSIIGCTLPDWTMSISNTIMYKNLDFTFDIRIVYGNDLVNSSTHNAEDRSGVANGFKTNVYEAWTPTNQNTMVAQRRAMKTYYDSYPDTRWLKNGSFLRGQNFVLGYNFGESLMKQWKIQSLRVYLSAQNLFCLTSKGFTGYDPEVSTRDQYAFGVGFDDFSEPKARSFTFGINVKF